MTGKAEHEKWLSITCIVFIAAMGLVLRLLIGAVYLNYFDLAPYNIPWALGARDQVFLMYTTLGNLDYPPLFPFLLSFLGDGIAYAKEQGIWQLEMLLVKLIPIFFDVLLIVFFYLIGSRKNSWVGLAMGAVWALNPSAIVNSAFWGQTDSLLLLWVGLMFAALHFKRTTAACVCFALGCLSKLQMVYFTPILLCELFFYYPLKKSLRSLSAGLITGVAGWAPFMIGSSDIFLPFRIYLGGFGKYDYVNVNADNFYGLFSLNWVSNQTEIAGGFTFSHLNAIIFAGIILLLLFGYGFFKAKGIKIPPVLVGLFFYNSIFMFTTKMHERYQLPVVVLALLAAFFYREKIYLFFFFGVVTTTFMNQVTLLLQANFGGVFHDLRQFTQPLTSTLNVVIYLFTVLKCLEYFYKLRQSHLSAVVVSNQL